MINTLSFQDAELLRQKAQPTLSQLFPVCIWHLAFLPYITTPSLGSRTQAMQGCNRMTSNPANNAFMSGACHNTWCTKHACSYLAIISTFPFDPLVTAASPLHSLEYHCRDLVEFTVIYNICYIEEISDSYNSCNPIKSND